MFGMVRYMGRSSNGPNFSDCLTVGQAASFLGVSTATLRNWDRSGKLKPRRHPQNGYRIYLHEDLQAILHSAVLTGLNHSGLAPQVDLSEMGESKHFVQFYESDEYLIDSVSRYVASALESGQVSAVVATLEHRVAIQRAVAMRGIDVPAAIESRRYIVLDAAEMLAKIMVDDQPNAQLFDEHFLSALPSLTAGGRHLYGWGEMVSLLLADGNPHAAIQLEEMWDQASKRYPLSVYCSYPIAGFRGENHTLPFNGICACHTRVIPSESYADIDNPDERLRAVCTLQQKAQSLDAEVAHRRQLEKTLSQCERELKTALARLK